MTKDNFNDLNKNLIGWVAISVTLIGGLVTMNSRISEHTVRIERNEQTIHELVKDQRKVYELMSQMRMENLQNFNDLKIQLTTKEDKK